MLSIREIKKPSNAGWRAKVIVDPNGNVQAAPRSGDNEAHAFESVEIAWYGDDRIKITLKDGAPAVIRQAYLTGSGQNVILDLVSADHAE